MVRNTGKAVVGGVKRGRPVGSRSDYTLTSVAESQRKMAALKHGNNSKILQKYVGGSKSPVPEVSDSDIVQLRKELYLNNLVRMVEEPTIVTMDVLAWLMTDLELAKLEADRDGEVLPDKLLKAARLASDLSTSLSKLKHGSTQTIEVKHLKGAFDDDDFVIPVRSEVVGDGER
jgi:hypothetical protein